MSIVNPVSKQFDSLLAEDRRFPPPPEFTAHAHISSLAQYQEMQTRALADPEAFWDHYATKFIHWFEPYSQTLDWQPPFARWFSGGKLNVSYNCLDRHVHAGRGDKTALIWQGEADEDVRRFTFRELLAETGRFANVLRGLGVTRGDRVCFYMPMIPELAIGLLACSRIGAVHSVVFGGFSADALRDRINDCGARILVTSNGARRAGKFIALKNNVDAAVLNTPCIEKVIVVQRTLDEIFMHPHRDVWYHDLAHVAETHCEPERMDAEDPLFILYTSGSTGKPKGVLHTTGGYLLYAIMTSRFIFDLKDDDIYWCTADIGWVTGHSYIVYGILGNGVTSLMFEGVPNYPQPDRFWQVVEKYKVTKFYTAPTALRSMMRDGSRWPEGRDLSSLKLLGSVGEPINPEAWMWYHTVIGKERCPVVDTWWQTETGGILICTLPGVAPQQPGSAGLPFPGVDPVILRADGSECETGEGGYLVIRKPWPGMLRSVWGDPERFRQQYFSTYPDQYLAGDSAVRDEDGCYRLLGRTDDVINVSGHRLGTMEIESALVAHPAVAEVAVVPIDHDIKGQGIYAFVTLIEGMQAGEELKKELHAWVRKEIGPIATPDAIQFAAALPQTRSGKIMRRILKKIAAGENGDMGDTSTLADPSVVQRLMDEKAAAD